MTIAPLENAALNAVSKLSMLKFFPTDEIVRAEIADLIECMASAPEQIQWLARVVVCHYDEWPGPETLRAIFCTRYQPRDGIERDLTSGPYAKEIEQRATETHERVRYLPPSPEVKRLLAATQAAMEVEPQQTQKIRRPLKVGAQLQNCEPECRDKLVSEAQRILSDSSSPDRLRMCALEILSSFGVSR